MPEFYVDQKTRKNAQRLRKNLTEAEKKLWFQISKRQIDGLKFRRQYPVPPYIVDFVCLERSLIIEIDGGQHDMNKKKDEKRTQHLKQEGFEVIRFWNNEVMGNIDGVLTVICEHLSTPTPTLPRKRGREKRSVS